MRLQFLDGFRGLAIMLVIIFHAYVPRIEHYPYGDAYANIPVINVGWLGVQLFFLISGFVIFMTLDKTESFRVFIYKRWLRLFPAMLIASVFIYSTALIFYERPDGIPPNLLSLLPGLTFTLPSWWSKLLGVEIQQLEMVFWSLYVEFKFYVIAGATFFILGRKFLIPALVALYALWLVTYGLSTVIESNVLSALKSITNALDLKHFGWFAAGSMFYSYFQNKDDKWFYAGITMMVLSAFTVRLDALGFDLETIIGALLISALFALSLKSSLLQRFLQNKLLTFFGFISYPLYLIHENMMTSLIIKMADITPWLHPFLTPYPAILFLVAVAYLISNSLEANLSQLLDFRKYPKLKLRLMNF